MEELAEIGRNGWSGWSGKSQLLTGWLCDGWFCFRWFGSGLFGVDRFLCRFLCQLPRPTDMLFLRLLLNIFSLLHTLRLHLPLHVSDNTHGWLISEIWHYLSLFAELSPPVVSSSSSYQVTTTHVLLPAAFQGTQESLQTPVYSHISCSSLPDSPLSTH